MSRPQPLWQAQMQRSAALIARCASSLVQRCAGLSSDTALGRKLWLGMVSPRRSRASFGRVSSLVLLFALICALNGCGGDDTNSASSGSANTGKSDALATTDGKGQGDSSATTDGADGSGAAVDSSGAVDGDSSNDGVTPPLAKASVWLQAFGGPAREIFESLWPTADGGAWLVGSTESIGAGDRDAWLVRVDGCGVVVSALTFGSTGRDEGRAMVELSSGDLLWVGITDSFEHGNEGWITRMSGVGEVAWSRVVGGSGWDTATAATATDDDGALVLGETYNFGPGTPQKHNALVVRVGGDGAMLWERTLGGGKDGDAAFAAAFRPSDGGFWVIGAAESFGQGHDDAWVINLDADGKLLWSRTYGSDQDDEARTLRVDADGTLWLAGFTRGLGAAKSDAFVLHVDALGALLGMDRYGTPGSERGYALVARPGGGQTLLGVTDQWDGADDGFALALDAQGEALWQRRIGGEKVDETAFAALARGPSVGGETLLWAGFTDSYGKGGRDAFAGRLQLDGEGGCKVRVVEDVWQRKAVTPIAADAAPTVTTGAVMRAVTVKAVAAPAVVGATSMCAAVDCL